MKCIWNYGVKKFVGDESWNMILKFDFDSITRKINPNTLECIQIS